MFLDYPHAYNWIDNAELKLEPGLRDKVQAVLHPDEPPRMTDAEFAAEHLVPRESTYEIDGRRFIVDSVNLDFGSVSLQDVTFQNQTGFPIFRSESIEFMRRLVEISEAQRNAELPTEPKLESETVAFYSAEDNHLPYDVEIRTIKAVEPEPPTPKPELHNFQITDDHLGEGGAKAKFRMNIAKQLYPKADITVAGFETTDRRDFYDLAMCESFGVSKAALLIRLRHLGYLVDLPYSEYKEPWEVWA